MNLQESIYQHLLGRAYACVGCTSVYGVYQSVCLCVCVSMRVHLQICVSARGCTSLARLGPGTVNPSTPHDFVSADS